MILRNSASIVALAAALLAYGGSAAAQDSTPTTPSADAAPEQEVEAIVVMAGAKVVSFRQGALKQDVVKTEVVSAATIEQLHAVNVNQAVDRTPGVAVQVECSFCNARTINLNNLPGRFTTLMIDGVPIFSSLSTTYGLDSVNVEGVESIDISRGAGASLIAPEALAGVVNIVTKKPTERRIVGSVDVGQYHSVNGTAYAAIPFTGGALALSGVYSRHDDVDQTGAGLSEYSDYRRALAGAALFLNNDTWRIRTRLDLVKEDRGGGSMGSDYAAIEASKTGNPFNWTKLGSPAVDGWYAPDGSGFLRYNLGRGGLAEIITTHRVQWVGVAERALGPGRFRFAAGYAHNKQDSFYEFSTYTAKGDQAYVEASEKFPLGQAVATVGVNWRYEDLRSTGLNARGQKTDGLDDFSYKTPAAYIQAYQAFFKDRLEVNLSARLDHHNVFGSIWSPRGNLLLHHTDNLSSRLSFGRGFRAPTSFFEQDHGVLDTVRIVRLIDKPETSDNLTYALNFSNDRVVWAASYNYNRIKNMAKLDSSAFDAQRQPITLFTSEKDPVTVQTVDFSGTWTIAPPLAMSLGAEKSWFDFTPGAFAFARPDKVLYATVDYVQKIAGDYHAHLYARASWTGAIDLARFYDYANTPRFNFDGSRKRDRSPDFVQLDLKATIDWREHLAFYVGVDNVTDFVQSKYESMLWIDRTGGIDTTHIWGPNRGRYVYAGLKAGF